MRSSLNICGKAVPLKIVAALIGCVVIGGVAALSSLGVINIGYIITPSTAESPTMGSSPLNLDLGTIPTGSSGTRDFEEQATLDLPVDYEITFTLDLETVTHFTTFNARIILTDSEDPMRSYTFYLFKNDVFYYESQIIDAGTYDVRVRVEYTAISVTAETSGTVQIDISYPG